MPTGAGTIQWYATSTGGDPLATDVALVNNTKYYASQTEGSCESASRLEVTVTINNPAAPTGNANQSFCSIDNPTVANLTATGTDIKWYDAASDGNLLSATYNLVDGDTYYATQTVGTCESDERFAVTVTINNADAPTGDAEQLFCISDSPKVSDLSVNETNNIKWYDAETGGNLLNATDNLVDGSTYYATQTVGSCESATRFAVTVTVNELPQTNFTMEDVAVCNGQEATLTLSGSQDGINYQLQDVADNSNVGDEVAGNTDGSEINFVFTPNETTTYQVYAYNPGCSVTLADQATVTVNPLPQTDYLLESDQAICLGNSAELTLSGSQTQVDYTLQDAADNSDIETISGTGNALTYVVSPNSDITYQIFALNTVTSCSAVLSDNVNVTVNSLPEVSIFDGEQKFCKEEAKRLSDIEVDGTNVEWYADEALTTQLNDTTILEHNVTYYCVSISEDGCMSETPASVTAIVELCMADVVIPEGFSPNNDGINDYFVIEGAEFFPENNLLIINRWGNKVYEADSYKNNWDGTNTFGLTIGGKELPEGTYFYIFTFDDKEGNSEIRKGYIYLKR